jgi:hypothetical protein
LRLKMRASNRFSKQSAFRADHRWAQLHQDWCRLCRLALGLTQPAYMPVVASAGTQGKRITKRAVAAATSRG